MGLKHSIIVSQEKISEFYNARTKYKALKYQVFGDDGSSGSDSDEELIMTNSALDRIQMMRSVFKFVFSLADRNTASDWLIECLKTDKSNNFENSLEGDQVTKAIKGEPPKASGRFSN